MSKNLRYTIIIFIVSILMFNAKLFAQNTLVIVAPNGGESWIAGTDHAITWTSTGVSDVKVEYSTDNGNTWNVETASTPDLGNSYTWTVPADVSADCLVRLSDVLDGNLSSSSAAIFTIAPAAPGLTVPADAAVSISLNPTFTWGDVASATAYQIQISTDSNFGTTDVDQSVVAATYSASNLLNNTTYYWKVRATVNGVASAYSPLYSFKTKLSTPVLSSPANASTGIAADVTLSWGDVAGAENYTLVVSTALDLSNPVYNQNNLVTASQAMNGLANNTLYYWRVTATQADGNSSDNSSIRSFRTIPATPVLTAPLDLAKSVALNPAFTWTADPSASQYKIQISIDNTFVSTKVNQTVTAATYSASNLSYNTTYYWRVQSTVNGVASDYSATRSFKTKLTTPTLSSPVNAAVGASVDVPLSWPPVTGAENYTLVVSAAADFSNPVYNQSIATSSQAMNGLANSTQYYWKVMATQADGNSSDYSSSRTFTTIHAAPTLLTPANNSLDYKFTKVTYTWAAVPNAVSYDLQVCKNSAFNTSDLKSYLNISATTYTPSDYLTYGTQYYWRVRVKVGTLNSEYANYFTFTTGTPSGSIAGDPDASIVFDHENGRISQITFKHGSGQQLLDTYYNDKNKTGLGRINSETNTKLASWVEAAGNYLYNYENSLYGSKSLSISWNATGIVVNMHLDLSANKAATIGAAWEPGGDNGPIHDFILYEDSDGLLTKNNLTYPGVTSTIYTGASLLTAMYDDRFSVEEFFGYTSSSSATLIQQGGSVFGPTYTFPSSGNSQSIDLNFAVKSKSAFFTWAAKKYIIVTSPVTDQKIVNQSSPSVTWESYGLAGNVDIKLSVDGGNTFAATLAAATGDDGNETVALPLQVLPKNNCLVQVAGTGASGNSGIFSIAASTSTVVTIAKDLTGSPTTQISFPITIAPGAGASISAFDIRLVYDKTLLKYVGNTPGALINNWGTFDVTNNSSSGYLQIGGFNSGGVPISAPGTIVTITFSILSTSRVGVQTPLLINNEYLSAADNNAADLNIIGENGLLTFYSRVSGYLRYFINNRPIEGLNLVNFSDVENAEDIYASSNSTGFYDFYNKIPGSEVTIIPQGNKSYPDVRTDAVDAVDAAKAFAGREGGATTLSPIQMIAADINNDGRITSTDAFAILQISTGALSASNFGANNWVFIDSTYKLTSSNWTAAPQIKTYSPLDTVKAKQSFLGMILGDVDGDYTPPETLSNRVPDFASYNSALSTEGNQTAVLFSVPADMHVSPGDTISLPINIELNGKSVGAFNVSLKVDKNIFSYTNKFVYGSSLPSDNGWGVSVHSDTSGILNIGATDFSGALDPISKDGTLIVFNFVVNNNVKPGDTSKVALISLNVADSKLTNVIAVSTGGKITFSNKTSVKEDDLIYSYSLRQNYPNPFNPSTVIEYTVARESRVEIDIYNALGQKIESLYNGVQAGGLYKLEWNAKKYSSGIYFYTIKAGEYFETKKMMLLK